MNRSHLLAACAVLLMTLTAQSQNVFDPADPILRYDSTKALGSAEKPNPNKLGLQKWVSIPTSGVTGTWDASAFKAYFANISNGKVVFRMKYPKTYITNPTKIFPVMIFFNGAGENGCPENGGYYNNEKQLVNGGRFFNDRTNAGAFDGFLIYIQKQILSGPCSGYWGLSASEYTPVISLLDSLGKYVRLDIDRVFVDGLSSGGGASWAIASNYPNRIAKIAPSASAGARPNYADYVHIPIWFATGQLDANPSPASATSAFNNVKNAGADIRHTLYPNLGHNVWNAHWQEPDFFPYMNDMHKANPLVFFLRNEFCPDSPINAKLGISAGYYAYEWQKDGVDIASRTNGVNTILDPSVVISYVGHEINVKALGTYRVRFKRLATSNWSEYSPKPVVVKTKGSTAIQPITVQGTFSSVLPALDGKTTVPLQLKAGFTNYQWIRVSDNVQVATTQVYNAPVGVYKGRYNEPFGCGISYSPNFTVVNANGTPKPSPASGLLATALSNTSIRLNWTDDPAAPTNETAYEVYRALTPTGPYTLVAITQPNIITYTDLNLTANKVYYYLVRAVCGTGAAAASNQATAKTSGDITAPSAPTNLQYRGSTQSSVGIRWNASTDNVGIRRYDIIVNGTKLYSTSSTSFNVQLLDSLKNYQIVVQAVDSSGNLSAPSNQINAYTHRQGVLYQYYNGVNTQLPNFNALTPVKTGSTDSINASNAGIRTQVDNYSFLWDGYFYVPVTATYTLETVSDAGSKLYIDQAYSPSATPVVDNDGVHTSQSRTGTIFLTEGYHRIVATYFETTGSEVMELYWSNDAGLTRERIGKNFMTSVSYSLPAIPAAPTNLTATALAFNRVRLNWADSDNQETGFEIERATNAGGPFVPVRSVVANIVTIDDTIVNPNTTYFYRMRSVSAGGESSYITANTTTPALPATPIAPVLLTATVTGNNITLAWNDVSANETNYEVWRSLNGTSSFARVAVLGANITAYNEIPGTSIARYYYYVVGTNASGSGEQSNIVSGTTGNTAPNISTVPNIFVKTDATGISNFTVTDNAGDIVAVTIVDKPAFLSVQNVSGTSYRITATPTVNDLGATTFTVQARDDKGLVSVKTFVVTVADKSTRSIFLNLGASGKTALAPWNNWLGNRGAGNVISSLKDENNVTTTISVTTLKAWQTTTDMGHITGNNSGVVPDAVLQSALNDTATTRQILIGGLNPALQYNLQFIGSFNEGGSQPAEYVVGATRAVLDARYNTNQSANLNGLVPDANGQITVTINRIAPATNTYLSGVVIEEISAAGILLNPVKLNAEVVDRNNVNLTWVDRSAGETAADGYELQRASDSLFTADVTTISLPENTTQYSNTGLTPDRRYWYRVRAKGNGNSYSDYSNSVKAITPVSMIYVNFNQAVPNAPTPWNNLAANPTLAASFATIRYHTNAISGYILSIEKVFNGEFNAGMNTGNNSGVVPDNVLRANYWLDKTQLSQVKLSGLNMSKKYRIGFVGSSSPNGWNKGNYTATYTVNGKTVYLNSWLNTTKLVYIDNISPDENGDIWLNFSTTATAVYGFNGGFILMEGRDMPESMTQFRVIPSNEITVPAGASELRNQQSLSMRVFPNPFKDFVQLELRNTVPANLVNVDIYDMAGRLAYRRQFSNLAAGVQMLRVNTSDGTYGPGVYIVTLKVNGKLIQTDKLIRTIR